MENSKYFYIWIGLSALLIAGSAAAFSVYGLAKLFSGAFISVVIMASSLELGKLVTASFLYRYWKVISWFQKVYMTFATLVLIGITSAGIFGYLSNAYQGATLEFEKQSTELIAVEERIEHRSGHHNQDGPDLPPRGRIFLKHTVPMDCTSCEEFFGLCPTT